MQLNVTPRVITDTRTSEVASGRLQPQETLIRSKTSVTRNVTSYVSQYSDQSLFNIV